MFIQSDDGRGARPRVRAGAAPPALQVEGLDVAAQVDAGRGHPAPEGARPGPHRVRTLVAAAEEARPGRKRDTEERRGQEVVFALNFQ